MRPILTAALLLLALALLVFAVGPAIRPDVIAPTTGADGDGDGDGVAAETSGPPHVERAAPTRRASTGIVLQVSDSHGLEIRDAFAFVVPNPATRFTVIDHRFPADDSGRITLPTSLAGSSMGVGATGHALTAIRLPDEDTDDPIRVELATGHTLTVQVTDAVDNPLEDLAVHVFPVGTALTWPPEAPDRAVGNPASSLPLHIARTSTAGEAVLPYLPAGEYHVATATDGSCPEVESAVVVPGQRATIRLQPAVGVIALPASDSEIVHSRIQPSRNAGFGHTFVRSACAWRQTATLQASLERNFPGAAVLVGFANPGIDQRVDVTAILDDGSVARGTWALLPLPDLEPVYLEVDASAGSGGLRIRLRNGDRFMAGIPVELYAGRNSDLPPVHIESDRVVRLPAGRWAIGAAGIPWLDDALEDRYVDVRAGDDSELAIAIPEPLNPLTISVSAAHGDLDVPHHVSFTHIQSGHGAASVNRSPTRPETVHWVPPGTIHVRAVAAGFEPAEASVDLTADDRSGAVELVLRRPGS